MKHKHLYLSVLTLGTVLGAAARFWALSAAIDSQGLPVTEHPATAAFIAVSVLFTLLSGVLAVKSPGRGVEHTVLIFSEKSARLSLAGAFFILIGSILSLFRSGGTAPLILFLLGAASSACLILVSQLRKKGNQTPPPELMPVVYLLIKLILSFKDWSTDPIILDYCDMLFAMIFTLLAFYGSAGFVFDRGQPRRTLFYASAGILFCAMAAVSSFMTGSIGSAVEYLGYLLWMIPLLLCLLTPREAPPKAAPSEK